MRRLLIAAALLSCAGAARAGIPVTERMTCPIGGERFDHVSTAAYTIFRNRPDGMPSGSWHFPLDLPECPGNGLIVYKEFDAGELRRLEAIIATDAFRALRAAGEVQYYRYAWLLREMGAPPVDHLWALAQAGWQAPVGSPLRARYLGEFAAGMAALPEPTDLTGFAMRGRWINALRELGRFDEAGALLARTDLARLNDPAIDEDEGEGWQQYYAMETALIGRRDSGVDPVDFLPREEQGFHCIDEAATLSSFDRAFCESEAMRERIAEARRLRAQYQP